jgi:hypothetical protein
MNKLPAHPPVFILTPSQRPTLICIHIPNPITLSYTTILWPFTASACLYFYHRKSLGREGFGFSLLNRVVLWSGWTIRVCWSLSSSLAVAKDHSVTTLLLRLGTSRACLGGANYSFQRASLFRMPVGIQGEFSHPAQL